MDYLRQITKKYQPFKDIISSPKSLQDAQKNVALPFLREIIAVISET
jgi:hypothetical protein